MRVVLGVSGGIAAYKACHVLRLLAEDGHHVTVVPTDNALRFVGAATWEALSGRSVATGVFDEVPGVPHVRLGQQADLVLVAPATADLLSRAATGRADDLLTNVLLTARCPVVMAPAMHTEMWQHPATVHNVRVLRDRGVTVVEPDSGRLTGADSGPGRLPEPERIVREALAAAVPVPRDLAGHHVLVTAGGTREPLDPVRYLGNRSSGKQGYAIAAEALRRGATVTLVSANVDLAPPAGARVVPVGSALELRDAVDATRSDAVVMAAAVADFRPARRAASKIKKTHGAGREDDAPVIELVRNPDILAGLVAARANRALPVIVGFAAETGDGDGDVLHHARAKLARKGCDLLVANEVGDGVTFGQDSSQVHLLRRDRAEVLTLPLQSKAATAQVLCTELATMLAERARD